MKYEIKFIIEQDDDYRNGDQFEDLKNDIEMTIADYNSFCFVGDIKIAEIHIMRYEISMSVEHDSDYIDQVIDLKNDIEMVVANFDCFCLVGDIEVTEVQDRRRKIYV